MKRRLSILWLTALLLTIVPLQGQAQDIGTCQTLMTQQLSREQRLYRSVLFGHKKAKDAALNEVYFDDEGIPWIKEKENVWRSVSPGKEDEERSNDEVDGNDELEPRKGIFETRKVMTSDLVPYLTQAYRSLKCRSTIICKVVENSLELESTSPQELTVVVPGCIEDKRPSILGCHLAAAEGSKVEQGDLLTYCRLVRDDLVSREKDLLKQATEYDAAYRSLLQLAGQMDAFLQEFRWPLINSLRKAAQLVGSLYRIPCFIGSCDESPPSNQ
ncbi:hypothetical protein AUJ46_03360 [Candidatus Peregrinibacteria bacterium CG1_02_54_53]|nr:MAG: hypothetical protein AUJ46_03360 [Candidatus Peregrinibacteria bacterium CG1_02_54_53]